MESKPSMVCINSFIDSLKLIIKHQDFHFLNTYAIGFNCSFLFVFCTSANFVIPSIIVSHRHISCVTHNVRLTLFNHNLSCQSKKNKNHLVFLGGSYFRYARKTLNPTMLSPRKVFTIRSPLDTLDRMGIKETSMGS